MERVYSDGKEHFPPEQLGDGNKIRVKHVATGLYLTAADDAKPLTVADLDADGESSGFQFFTFWKQGRPLGIKHKDLLF